MGTQIGSQPSNRTPRFAWFLLIATFALNFGSLVLIALTPVVTLEPGWGFRGYQILVSLPAVTLGFLILRRSSDHIIGWLSCLLAFAGALQGFLTEYILRAIFVVPGTLPVGIFAAWVTNWIWVPIIFAIAFILLYFPNGKLLSERWRYVLYFLLLILIPFIGSTMFLPGPLVSSIGLLPNPYGVPGSENILNSLFTLGNAGWIVGVMLAALSLLIRFRRSRGVERQQIKWVLYAGALLALAAPLASSGSLWPQVILILGFGFVFIAIGVAILRYRLYDIDILIRRTLTYGLVTACLALVFFGSVIVLQQIFSSVTGSGQNEIVTVLSTLAIAALFVPIRTRVQQVIDKRFNRNKYDAQVVLQDFAKTVRDETDLEKLTARLMQVVDETMQPKSVSVWLKKETRGTGNK